MTIEEAGATPPAAAVLLSPSVRREDSPTAAATPGTASPNVTPAKAGVQDIPPTHPDWREGLPQELRDALGDDADPAEAAKTYALGREYKPAQQAEDIALKLGDGEQLHPGLEKLFKDMCVAQRMTPAQAQAVADFHGRFAAEATRLYLEHGAAQLERRFGADAGKVRDNALKMFAGLDRAMDGRLSQSASGKQIASSPEAVEALYLIYQKLGEDSLGGGSPSGGEDRAMSDKEFFEHVYNNQSKQSAKTA
jgi:hypothetical protein